MMKYMRRLDKDETLLAVAALKMIDEELRRCYWNKYQEEMNSPFSNTGESYSCDAFTVRAYNWIITLGILIIQRMASWSNGTNISVVEI